MKPFVEVRIFGENYKLVSENNNPELLRQIANMVDQKLQNLSEQFPQYSPSQVAVLGALNLADELFQAHHEADEAEKKIESLIHFLKHSMKS